MGYNAKWYSRREQSCFEFITLASNLRHSVPNYHFFYDSSIRAESNKGEEVSGGLSYYVLADTLDKPMFSLKVHITLG